MVSTNDYIRDVNSRFGIRNFNLYDEKRQYTIVDRKTGKEYGYDNINKRNKAFKRLIKQEKR